MGIANPVTRETHGSGTHYHMQLAKQLGDMLQAPLEVCVSLVLHPKRFKQIVVLFFVHNIFFFSYVLPAAPSTPQERGGMMALTEVYCLVNRARGMEVMLT